MEQANIYILIRSLNSTELDSLYFFLQDLNPESSRAKDQISAILEAIEEENN